MKKKIGILLISLAMISEANDTADMKFIYKLYKNQYYKQTTLKLEEFLKEYPTSKLYESALNLLGFNYYALKEYDKAKRTYEKLKISDFEDEAYYYLTKIALEKGEEKAAENYLKEIRNSSELKKNGVYTLATYYYKKNEYTKAAKFYRELLKEDGKYYTKSLLNLGLVYYEQGEYTRTTAILEEYILNKTKKDKNISQVLYIIAYSNEMIGDKETALKYYKQIEENYQKSEYYEEAIYNMIKIYKETGKKDKSRENIFKLMGTKYEKNALLILAEYEYENENYEKAKEIYEKLIKEKETADIRYKLVVTLLMMKEEDLALKEAKELKETKYVDEYYYYTTYIYYKQKEFTEILNLEKEMRNIEISEEYKKDIFIFIANSAKEMKKYDLAKKYFIQIETAKSLAELIKIAVIQNNEVELREIYEKYIANYQEDLEYKKTVYIETGNFYVKIKRYDLAEKIYKKYLKKYNDEDITNNLIVALLNQDKYEEIIQILNKKEENLENLYKKGIAYLKLHQYRNASTIYLKILEKPENKYTEKTYKNLIISLFTEKEYEKVLKYTSEYLEKYTKNKDWMMDKKGQVYLQKNEYNKALIVYNRLLKSGKMKDYAIFMLGEIEYNRKNKNEALKYYENVVLNYPNSKYKKSSLYWIINLNYEQENYEKAIKYSKYFLKTYDSGEYISEIIYYLGNIYMKKNEMDLAIKEYKKIATSNTINGLSSNVLEKLIRIYYEQNKYDEALSWIDKLEDKGYKIFWQGLILEKQGKEKEALEKYKLIINDKKQGAKANYYIGSYFYRKQNLSAARNYFSKVLEFKVSEYKDKALLKIALTYEEEQNYQRAITTLLRIKLIYEESKLQDIVAMKLGEIYEKTNEIQKSLNLYLEVYRKYKESKYYPVALERLLQYYIKEKNKEEMKKYYEEMKKNVPERAKLYKDYFKSGGIEN
ncbi:MAG: hypothetical protein B6I28_01050 [Fusobacteriia bacterium 4572_132]|nr:MAG: hypothetical protein B6I28_01050 [Fusobacteriia bacterium 4572_132]